ncbi:MAG: helix-turn-helix transcriptional regulator [Armatimonadetes bacterium]|nr:helix-turn-helix transcriptional regulator [Armatimonadota bacterium]
MAKSIPLAELLASAREDPEYRAVVERHAVADAVSLWLVKYRARHGLTQRSLAARVGMQQSAIARLEQGDIEPKMSTLLRLARSLGEPLELEIVRDDPATAETVVVGSPTTRPA